MARYYKRDLRSFMEGFIRTTPEQVEESRGGLPEKLLTKARRAFGKNMLMPERDRVFWRYILQDFYEEIEITANDDGICLVVRVNTTYMRVRRTWDRSDVLVEVNGIAPQELFQKIYSVALEYTR